MVECQLPKLKVASSILVARSTYPMRPRVLLLTILLAAFTGDLFAQGHTHSNKQLGKVDFRVDCTPQAQAEFSRGIALLHHMTYPQARAAFQSASTSDPKCAMAPWGVAMTLFQPLWPTRPSPADLQRGWDLVQKAKSDPSSSSRDQLLIAAAEAFFLEPASKDYWLRIGRWEKAMAAAYSALPADMEVAALYSLAHLAAAPADKISRENQDSAAKILLEVYRKNPDHPGAMHYLVHANDVPGRESELLEVTKKYEKVAPRNPHALHMPTHIYTRLGDWDGVIRGNLLAADAALEHPAGERGEFVWDEFPHAIEYLVYAELQKGADEKALEQINRLLKTERVEPTFKTAFHIVSSQARYVLERHAWKEAENIVPRTPSNLNWDRFAWPEAIAHFARGVGYARTGNILNAATALKRIDELEAATRTSGESLFARNIKILSLELGAWIAQAESRKDEAIALMKSAVDLEVSTPKHAVTPGPTIPAYEQMGELYIEQGRPADALSDFKLSLRAYPNRFNSLIGSARAAVALREELLARESYQQLLNLGRGGTRESALREAREYLSKTPKNGTREK